MNIDPEGLLQKYPHVWSQGYKAFAQSLSTLSCPHQPISPLDTDHMNAWLSGWLTAQQDEEEISQ